MKKRELGFKTGRYKLGPLELTSFYNPYRTNVFTLLLTPFLSIGSALIAASYFKKNGVKVYLTPTSLAVYITYDASNKDTAIERLFESINDFRMSQDELDDYKIKSIFGLDGEDRMYSELLPKFFGDGFNIEDEIKKVNLTSVIKEIKGLYNPDGVQAFYFGNCAEGLKNKSFSLFLSEMKEVKKKRGEAAKEKPTIKKDQINGKAESEISKVSFLVSLPNRESLCRQFSDDVFAYLAYLPYFFLGGFDKFISDQEKASNIITSSGVKIIEKNELILVLNSFSCVDSDKLISSFKKRKNIRADGFSFSKVKSIIYQKDAELAYDYVMCMKKWVEARENNLNLDDLINSEINMSLSKFSLISKAVSSFETAIYLQLGDRLK